MRITGGELGGRRIGVPEGRAVRPTQDRVREALFSSLGAAVEGAAVLDLFAGSGALGLEAWSRGAGRVCWVERAGPAFENLRRNVVALCGEEAARGCVCMDVFAFLRQCRTAYDFILADPPYDRHTVHGAGDRLLEALAEGAVKPSGWLIYEQHAAQSVPVHADWELVRDRVYGRTKLLYFRYRPGGGAS
jgi:16S rRNA (guanine966-N2)-methyltransferase